MKATVKWH